MTMPRSTQQLSARGFVLGKSQPPEPNSG